MSADTSVEDVSPRGDVASPLAQAAGLLISYQEHVLAWQREAWRISFAEISLLQSGALSAMCAVVQPPIADESEQQRFMGLAGMWLKLATELQVAMLRAFGPPLTASDVATAVVPDRRVKSVVINFPERRVA